MKQPRITWRKGGDDKIQFIVKIVAYKRDYGMVMAVTKTNDEIQPNDFTFFFPYDTDESKGTLMTFYKKNWPIKTIGTEKLGTLAEEEIGVTFDNHLTFSNTGETVNLMKLCLQSDAILFKYTSKDGEPKKYEVSISWIGRALFRAVHLKIQIKATTYFLKETLPWGKILRRFWKGQTLKKGYIIRPFENVCPNSTSAI